ncbi:MAG TPA: SDR family oxidoreductase, partial [Planctomycetota bacterium]|nr:SDR family oxidoreductase [Planctomycetota bacterium]
MDAPTGDGFALVTGAGAGIGAAIARALAADGLVVVLHGRRREPLERVAADVDAAGGAARIALADLSTREGCASLVSQVAAFTPRLRVLVHNAGVGGPTPLLDRDDSGFDLRMETNLAAPMRLTRSLLPAMARDGRGRIIAVSSIVAKFGVPDLHAYCASKAGLVGFCRALAKDLGRERITVNAVLPGWTRTAMAEASWTLIGGGAG